LFSALPAAPTFRGARSNSPFQQERQAGNDAARAASYALGHHNAEAAHVWRRAGKAWRKLERSPRFWA